MSVTALSGRRIGDNLAIEQHIFWFLWRHNVPNDVDKNKHMQSALHQSSLNQPLGVIHKLISNVQPCRIAERLKELHRILFCFFLNSEIKRKQNVHEV